MARQELQCHRVSATLERWRMQRVLQRWRASAAARGRLRERAHVAAASNGTALQLSRSARRQIMAEHGPGGLAVAAWRAGRLRAALAAWVQAASG